MAGFGRSSFGRGPFGRSDLGSDLLISLFPQEYFDDSLLLDSDESIRDNDKDPLLMLLRTFKNSVNNRRVEIDKMPEILDYEKASLDIVRLFGEMLGLGIDKNDPEFLQRSFLGNASAWIQLKGSTRGYQIRGLASGFTAEVVPFWRISSSYEPYLAARSLYNFKPAQSDPTATKILHTDYPPGGFLVATGDGSTSGFAGFIPVPTVPNLIQIKAGSVSGSDDGLGTISGAGLSGSISYGNGNVFLMFATPPADGVEILATKGEPWEEEEDYAKSAYVRVIFETDVRRTQIVDFNKLLDLVILKIKDVVAIHHELLSSVFQIRLPVAVPDITVNFQEINTQTGINAYVLPYYDSDAADIHVTDLNRLTVEIFPSQTGSLTASLNTTASIYTDGQSQYGSGFIAILGRAVVVKLGEDEYVAWGITPTGFGGKASGSIFHYTASIRPQAVDMNANYASITSQMSQVVPVGGMFAFDTTLALTESGALEGWGSNYWGELGIGTSQQPDVRYNLIQPSASVDGLDFLGAGDLPSGSNREFSQIHLGHSSIDGNYVLAIEKGTGISYSWGTTNSTGVLGRSGTVSEPGQIVLPAGVSGFSKLSAGSSSMALDASGNVYVWGGSGSSTPTQMILPPGQYTDIASSQPEEAENDVMFAMRADGKIYSWTSSVSGTNLNGLHGNGTTAPNTVPTEIDGTYSKMSIGNYHAAAIESGTNFLYVWGRNNYGQLGLGDLSSRLEPTVIDGGRQFEDVKCGEDFIVAIEKGSLQILTWGKGTGYRLGLGNDQNQMNPAPVSVQPPQSNLFLISQGSSAQKTISLPHDAPLPWSNYSLNFSLLADRCGLLESVKVFLAYDSTVDWYSSTIAPIDLEENVFSISNWSKVHYGGDYTFVMNSLERVRSARTSGVSGADIQLDDLAAAGDFVEVDLIAEKPIPVRAGDRVTVNIRLPITVAAICVKGKTEESNYHEVIWHQDLSEYPLGVLPSLTMIDTSVLCEGMIIPDSDISAIPTSSSVTSYGLRYRDTDLLLIPKPFIAKTSSSVVVVTTDSISWSASGSSLNIILDLVQTDTVSNNVTLGKLISIEMPPGWRFGNLYGNQDVSMGFSIRKKIGTISWKVGAVDYTGDVAADLNSNTIWTPITSDQIIAGPTLEVHMNITFPAILSI